MKDAKVCKTGGAKFTTLHWVLFLHQEKATASLARTSHAGWWKKRSALFVLEKLAPLLQHSVVNICIVGSAHATGKFVRIKPYSLLCKVTITCFLKGYLGLSVCFCMGKWVWGRSKTWLEVLYSEFKPLFPIYGHSSVARKGTFLGFCKASVFSFSK